MELFNARIFVQQLEAESCVIGRWTSRWLASDHSKQDDRTQFELAVSTLDSQRRQPSPSGRDCDGRGESMATLKQEYEEITSRRDETSRFFSVALHVHSPGSHDFGSRTCDKTLNNKERL